GAANLSRLQDPEKRDDCDDAKPRHLFTEARYQEKADQCKQGQIEPHASQRYPRSHAQPELSVNASATQIENRMRDKTPRGMTAAVCIETPQVDLDVDHHDRGHQANCQPHQKMPALIFVV